MSSNNNNNNTWDSANPKDGLVTSTNGVQLHLVSNGAPRQANQPVVILEGGLGASGANWAAVSRLLDPRIRNYRYDRAGYGNSPVSTQPRTAETMARELRDVLDAAGIAPPYILVAHSYGAIIARELLALAGAEAVAGMVLIDANQEATHTKLQVPFATIESLKAGRDYFDIIGLKANNSYTPEELGRIAIDASVATTATTAGQEHTLLLDSSATLGAKRQLEASPLGTKPVTVIRGDTGRDFRMLVAASGTPEKSKEVEEMNEFLAKRFDVFDCELQKEQLRLSGNSRFVQATNSGHVVGATEPQLIADEILSVWKQSLV